MNQEISSFNIKNTIESFKTLPKVFKLLWSVRKLYLLLITVLYLISGVLPTISILSTQWLLNAIQAGQGKEFTNVLYPLIVYLILSFFSYIVFQLNSYLQSIFRVDLNYKLNTMILEKAKALSLSDFEDSAVYDKLRRAQNETIEKPYVAFSITLNIVSQFVGFISSLTILLHWNPLYTSLVLIVPIISTIYIFKIGYIQYKIEYERSQERRKAWYFGYLLTNDIAFKEIRIYNLGDFFIKGYKNLNKKLIKQDKQLIKKRTAMLLIFEILNQAVNGYILYLIVKSAYIGKILLGNTVAYIRTISNVKGNMEGMLSLISAIYQNNLYIKQLFEFLEMPSKEDTMLQESKRIKEIQTIEFNNVSFKYPNMKVYALKDITFKVEKGENISLVGENGSGKTTLIKLLSGFYNEFEGEILINNISIKEINQESLGQKIGVLFQDFNRYEMTLRENIGMGKLEHITNGKKLKDAMEKAYATEISRELPSGIDTQLGVWFEGGVQLSGGQWQRIALSRAFLRDADIYILDEPSSSLDPISENEIFKKTLELTRDKIGIFISHRLYNLKRIPSRIMVLKDGKLVEAGTHDELMSLEGYYSYLYNLQNPYALG